MAGTRREALLFRARNAQARGHFLHRRGAHAVGVGHQAGIARVRRHPGGGLERPDSVVGARAVGHFPSVVLVITRAVDLRLRADALLDGRRQREHLERRSRLPPGIGGEVELGLAFAFAVVASADHGQHVAGVRVDAGERKLHVGVAGIRHAFVGFLRCLLGISLQRGVDGGVHGQPAGEHLVVRQAFEQLLAHVAGEVRIQVDAVLRARGRQVERQGLGLRRVVFFLRDDVVGKHAVEHRVAALLAVLGIGDGLLYVGDWGMPTSVAASAMVRSSADFWK